MASSSSQNSATAPKDSPGVSSTNPTSLGINISPEPPPLLGSFQPTEPAAVFKPPEYDSLAHVDMQVYISKNRAELPKSILRECLKSMMGDIVMETHRAEKLARMKTAASLASEKGSRKG